MKFIFVGSQPDKDDVVSMQQFENIMKAVSGSMAINNGKHMYATVHCINGVGTSSSETSDPLFASMLPPDALSATAVIHEEPIGEYAPLNGHQKPGNVLTVSWTGFQNVMTGSYHVQILSELGQIVADDIVGESVQMARHQNLILDAGTSYKFVVKAVNSAGESKAVLSQLVHIGCDKPHIEGKWI